MLLQRETSRCNKYSAITHVQEKKHNNNNNKNKQEKTRKTYNLVSMILDCLSGICLAVWFDIEFPNLAVCPVHLQYGVGPDYLHIAPSSFCGIFLPFRIVWKVNTVSLERHWYPG